jgi:hypothetical protein
MHEEMGRPLSHVTGETLETVIPGAGVELLPVRAYRSVSEIPPSLVGAYGLVAFQTKATPSNRAKLLMVCRAFVATFPLDSQVPLSVPLRDRMMTIWPVEDSQNEALSRDDCEFVVDHYDLVAAEMAMKDARLQNGKFDGEGPYLIGWSPTDSRGKKDKLVLIVDLSAANDQTSVDRRFLFWKQKIVEDPSLWRSGFSLERVRVAIKDFADRYGQDMLDAVQLVKGD